MERGGRYYLKQKMKTERQKMLDGELYHPLDEELITARTKGRMLLKSLNESSKDNPEKRAVIINSLIPNGGKDLWVQPPFYCDYGTNIITGEGVFFNFNCVLLDVMQILIGSRTLFGPNVQVYTATHPIDYKIRASGLENGKPVSIGEDVWIGGGAIILPGVSIGDRAIIGAGSIVTREVPADVMAAGNPCRVIRKL